MELDKNRKQLEVLQVEISKTLLGDSLYSPEDLKEAIKVIKQKMIACQLFDRVELGNGYQITIHMNITYKQFCSDWGTKCIQRTA